MGSLETWISILGLPIASGVNLYATVLVLGLGQRFGLFQGLPHELDVVSNPIVITIAAVLYFVEFFADKIPYLDTLWDGIHTFIRPAGAAYLAMQAASGHGTEAKLLAVVIGGVLGLGAHSTKAGTRMLVNTSPEPVSNSIVSVAEDFGVVGLLALMYTHPMIALGIVLTIITLMAVIAPLLFRLIRFLLGGAVGALSALLGGSETRPVATPDWVMTRLPENANARAFPGFSRNVAGAPSFQPGYLVISNGPPVFAFRTLFRTGVVALGENARPEIGIQTRLLFDVVVVETGRRRALLCVSKDRSAAVRAELGLPDASEQYASAGNR